ncbi:hypothetical protein [Oceanisphaera psychrotolerans]|uniref:Uncharacterized protein n=1 Tax=Oceanisphaera psychrotolerans TaxID=1414654 RepID=A0A1J4QCI5_9GAMM|nr:hypothetical protein [Oceanisphaera psychrotolerans]OIN09095.1 hypothetical protein BFR47_02120 [Oceanisphaera psychrotolerans]
MSKYVFADVFVIRDCRQMVRRFHGTFPPEVTAWLGAMSKEQAVVHREVYISLANGTDERKLKGKYWEFKEAWQEQRGKLNRDPDQKYLDEIEDQWRRDQRGKW